MLLEIDKLHCVCTTRWMEQTGLKYLATTCPILQQITPLVQLQFQLPFQTQLPTKGLLSSDSTVTTTPQLADLQEAVLRLAWIMFR